ncbi:MAG TPA: hypothetical protein VFP20_09835 [Bacteroidales bacterium]|nr:hypothetical protein [Bacteroidales bacterium]
MKKHYLSLQFKKIALIGLMALFCVAPKAFSQWTGQWNGTDLASFTSLFSLNSGGLPDINTVVEDSTPGIVSNYAMKFGVKNISGSSTLNYKHSFSASSLPNGVTLLFRVKGYNSAFYGEVAHVQFENGSNKTRFRIKKSSFSDDYTASGSIPNTNFPSDFNHFEDYQIVRLASVGNTISVYLNENPTPLYSTNSTSTSSSRSFWIGKSSSGSSFAAYWDWFLWDETGAYAPGAGQPIPGDFVKSNNTRLSGAQLGGVEIPQFDRDTLVYKIGVAHGAAVPVISGTPAHRFLGATCTVTQATSIPGSATINVKAADGVTPDRAYTINFVDGLSADNTLKSVKVGTIGLAQFVPGINTWDVKVPSSAVTAPLLTCVTNERYATTVVTDATSLPGTATIEVTAQDGTKKTYTFNLSAASLSEASLTDIKVNGLTIPGFDPATLTYNVVLPAGTIALPTVSSTRTDNDATSTRVDATALPGTTTITVTSKDASTVKTYTINFTVSTTGLKNVDSDNVWIYTSANSTMNVRVPESMVNGMMYIYGINGALKSQTKLNSTNVEMNINNLASGIYAVKIVGRDGMTVVKKLAK